MKILLEDTIHTYAFYYFLFKDILLNLILLYTITLITIYINDKIIERIIKEK